MGILARLRLAKIRAMAQPVKLAHQKDTIITNKSYYQLIIIITISEKRRILAKL